MKITTLRFPEGMIEDMEDEAEERDLSLSEYVRSILRKRDRIPEENTPGYDERIRELEQKVRELESHYTRVDDEENKNDGEDTDLIEWLRENQPASKKDILEHCVPSDYPGKPRSWWDRHGRQELRKAGAEHTRNVGWSID